jgi:hypothetical protein
MTRTIDLQPFCGKEESRPYVNQPFRIGDFTFATDGRILLRIPAEDGDLPPAGAPGGLSGQLVHMFKDLSEAVFAAPGSATLPPAPPTGECPSCDGRGFVHDCPHCECVCKGCDGRGDLDPEKATSTTFAGATFCLAYIRQMLALPSIEIAAETAANGGPMLFRFAGGVGVLMPMRCLYARHIEIVPAAA